MSAVWFFVGYIIGAVVGLAAVFIGYRIAERRDQQNGGVL